MTHHATWGLLARAASAHASTLRYHLELIVLVMVPVRFANDIFH